MNNGVKCMFRDCDKQFNDVSELITHLKEIHPEESYKMLADIMNAEQNEGGYWV